MVQCTAASYVILSALSPWSEDRIFWLNFRSVTRPSSEMMALDRKIGYHRFLPHFSVFPKWWLKLLPLRWLTVWLCDPNVQHCKKQSHYWLWSRASSVHLLSSEVISPRFLTIIYPYISWYYFQKFSYHYSICQLISYTTHPRFMTSL
jgi:hypothetical protein